MEPVGEVTDCGISAVIYKSATLSDGDLLYSQNSIDALQSALKPAQERIKYYEAITMTFHARLTELLEMEKQGVIGKRDVGKFLVNRAEAIQDLVVAAEKAQEAMNVWVNTYAPEFCDKEHVENSRKIISESGGTLAYIADINEQIHEALAKLEQP